VILKVTPDCEYGRPVMRFEGHDKAKLKEQAADFVFLQKREPGVTYIIREIDYR
jgi:hypothetical protein